MADSHGHDVFHHIRDAVHLELPGFLGGHTPDFPKIDLGFTTLQLTKFMLLQVVAGFLVLFIFWGLARHIRNGSPARGRFWNFWEMLALFIRDEVARPAIGTGHHHEPHHPDHGERNEGIDLGSLEKSGDIEHHSAEHVHHHEPTETHPADRYLPYIWSCFFFVLFCNLLGAIPWLGSATGHISVTGALAITTLAVVVISGIRELGVVGYWKSLVPGMDVPGLAKVTLVPMVWVIEFVGLIIKHGVLAVRLFANIMAGHTVLAVILGFIGMVAAPNVAEAYPWLFYVVTPASIFGQVAIGLLELFVAFLQAYIFAFLSALFIGAAVHPH